ADGGSSLAVYPGDRRHGRRVRIAVVSGGGAGIRRDYNCRVSLGDVVGDYGIADVVVVTGAITERPIIIVISAGVGMGRMAQIETAQALCLHTLRRPTGGVRVAVVSHVIRRDRDCGIGFGDVVGDYGIADVVVVTGAITERPIIIVISAGVGMGRMAQIETAQALCLHTFGSSTGGMRVAVVSHVIRRDRDCGIGFGDVVGDYGITDVVVVTGAITERPIIIVIS